ncbi:MAG: flagellar basal body P-ring protein FlgI [Planctomycetes bacterium]|nr:flagellar basal body P-ring protein FlgI [Planctomycetota bacterium]
MRTIRRCSQFASVGAIVALCATTAHATTIQELVRIKGHEHNVITGMGLVIGLNGTGDDSRQALIAARPYGELLRNYGNAALSVAELAEADAYAIVQVTMELPATGVREGDRLNVYVDTMFNATSLAGGRLVVSPLRLPLPDSNELMPMAFATGSVIIQGDNPRSGIVRNGGQMLTDVRTSPITAAGTMGLVLKDQYASYPVATTIAAAINDEFALDGMDRIAIVEDAKTIKVLVPAEERRDPAEFIATLVTISIDPSLIRTEARIVINEREGIIVVTGNVEISPVGITHKGLSISPITPRIAGGGLPGFPGAGQGQGRGSLRRWTGLDTTGRQSRNSTRLLDLLSAFDQLMVPVDDQIAIIYELKKTGALHAEIVGE